MCLPGLARPVLLFDLAGCPASLATRPGNGDSILKITTMKMQPADIKKYAKLAYYVRHDLPQILTVPVIVSAMQKIGQTNLSRLRLALQWGHLPGIRIVPALEPVMHFWRRRAKRVAALGPHPCCAINGRRRLHRRVHAARLTLLPVPPSISCRRVDEPQRPGSLERAHGHC